MARKKILFVSYRQVRPTGFSAQQKSRGISIEIRENVETISTDAYLEMVGELLRQKGFYRIIVYFGLSKASSFAGPAALLKRYPKRLIVVTCDCEEEKKRTSLVEGGVDPDRVHWTKECGGYSAMSKLLSHLLDSGEFPEPSRLTV